MSKKTPIVLMTFAPNDLYGVKDEIQKIWNAVSTNPDINPKKIENADIEQMADAVIDAGKDLFMFHFGGHADQKGIVLDGFRDLDKIRLSRLILPNNHNVQLVFLNGCLSYGHVGILTAKGVKAIVATNVKVNDGEAVRIAAYFYKLFFEKEYSLKDAFETAEATVKGDNAYITIVNPGEIDENKPLQPAWTLFVHSEHKEVMDWTLKEFLTPSRKTPTVNQTHSGKGDNVGRDKIDRQINMGDGSTYIENQTNNPTPPKPDLSSIKTDVQNIIAKGQLEKALDYLKNKLPDQQDDITQLQSRIARLNRGVRMGTISVSDESIEHNRITAAILSIAKP